MNKLPISLLFLTSTRGHFGRKDIYARTLQDWQNKGFLDLFEDKIANIKVDNLAAEHQLKDEMQYKIRDFGFDACFYDEKPWKHFDESHFLGIIDDINYLAQRAAQPFCFLLEDDWILNSNKENLIGYLESAMNVLNDNSKICVRVPRHRDDAAHYLGTESYSCDFGEFNRQGILYSNNPHIISTKYLYVATTLAKKNPDLIRHNCEVGMTNIFKNFTHDEKPFLSFKPELIRTLHIGTKPGEEDKIE